MSTAIGVQERVSGQQLKKYAISTLPRFRKNYLADSELFKIKGGFDVEVIHDPGTKIREEGLFDQVKHDLGPILLAAFDKEEGDAETFLTGNKFTKVAMDVDCLVVVRKSGMPVAFGAGTFIASYLFYMNSLMVLPEFKITGLGFFTSTLLWDYAMKMARRNGYQEPDVVVRTRNRKVASGFLHLLKEGKISTEQSSNAYDFMILEKTAKYLDCKFDPGSGIVLDAYPEGLPDGNESNDFRITEAFDVLGTKDACFINGKLDVNHIERLTKRYISKVKTEEHNPFEENFEVLNTAASFA